MTAFPAPTVPPGTGTGTGGLGSRAAVRLVLYVAISVARQRIRRNSLFFYALVWLSPTVFGVLTVALIYRGAPDLQEYAIVAGAALALLFGMQYNAGQILDEERRRGTLGNLFVSPGPRYVWLAGFQLFAVCESLVATSLTAAVGMLAFGVSLETNLLGVLVTLALLLLCMWGFSMLVGAIGLALRDANQLSNLLYPFFLLMSGGLYPLDRMPSWLQGPARCLPFGYALQALGDAGARGASLGQLTDDLLPLGGFALVLPVLGVLAFRTVERRVRRLGALELV